MYGQPGYGPPPQYPAARRSAERQSIAWLVSAGLVVVAAVSIIVVVLAGGSRSPGAGGATPPNTSDSTSPSGSASSPSGRPSPSITAPTTDALPDNTEAVLCSSTVQPQYVAVALVTVLSGVQHGTPGTYANGVLTDCVSGAVRSRISQLYGVSFGVDYSGDLSGGNNSGPTAEYTVGNSAGTATLKLFLTKQQDGHYELTDYTYG